MGRRVDRAGDMSRPEAVLAIMLLAPATIIAVVALIRGYDILIIKGGRRRRDDD